MTYNWGMKFILDLGYKIIWIQGPLTRFLLGFLAYLIALIRELQVAHLSSCDLIIELWSSENESNPMTLNQLQFADRDEDCEVQLKAPEKAS